MVLETREYTHHENAAFSTGNSQSRRPVTIITLSSVLNTRDQKILNKVTIFDNYLKGHLHTTELGPSIFGCRHTPNCFEISRNHYLSVYQPITLVYVVMNKFGTVTIKVPDLDSFWEVFAFCTRIFRILRYTLTGPATATKDIP